MYSDTINILYHTKMSVVALVNNVAWYQDGGPICEFQPTEQLS